MISARGDQGPALLVPRRAPYDAVMLRVALRPRFLGLLALMIAATLVCGLLATWQWDRAHRAITADPAEKPPVALGEVLAVDEPVTNEDAGRPVTAVGVFEPSEQVLVPGRRIEDRDAVIIVTALHVTSADGTAVRLPVARGWMPAEELTGADGALDASRVPAPPPGEVEVAGRLEASEQAQSGIAADGTAAEISTALLVNAWGSPMYSGYVAQTETSGGLEPMPAAESDFSRGLNLQNLGYAAQWIVFGLFFLYLWWRSVRTRFLDEEADRADALAARLGAAEVHTGGSTPAATAPAAAVPDDVTPGTTDTNDASAPRGAEEDGPR